MSEETNVPCTSSKGRASLKSAIFIAEGLCVQQVKTGLENFLAAVCSTHLYEHNIRQVPTEWV